MKTMRMSPMVSIREYHQLSTVIFTLYNLKISTFKYDKDFYSEKLVLNIVRPTFISQCKIIAIFEGMEF